MFWRRKVLIWVDFFVKFVFKVKGDFMFRVLLEIFKYLGFGKNFGKVKIFRCFYFSVISFEGC